MKLIFIRHAEPDYEHDTLTEKGWKEAKLLAERVKKWEVNDIYLSPLGRAQDTASFSVKALGKETTTLDWLQEFWCPVTDPTTRRFGVPWDFMPEFFTKEPLLYDKDHWFDADVLAANAELKERALRTFQEFDSLLASYGYVREGGFYRVDHEKYDKIKKDAEDVTLVFFCHLGITLLLLGYMMGISPSLLWQSIFIAPSSVTVLNAEERMNHAAFFRAQVIGDTRHLYDGNEPISSAGCFVAPWQET